MFKLISHLLVFAVGAGAGIYWGVHHPNEAADISATESARIQQAVAVAKQDVLQKVIHDQASPDQSSPTAAASGSTDKLGKYKQMLQDAQQEASDAKSKLGQ